MHRELDQNQLYVTVDLLILTVRNGRLLLLLSRRINPPFQDTWGLPGRFVGLDETAEKAAQLLLEEMLPVPDAFLEQLYSFSDVGRDPRGRVISMAYLVLIPWEKLAQAESSFRAFIVSLDEHGLILTSEEGDMQLSAGDLAFDHGKIVETGISRLRGKIDYTDIGFYLLSNPDAFSLSELQTVFEAVLEQTLDTSNFRRWLRTRYEKDGRLIQTSQAESKGRGRPAALYTLKDLSDNKEGIKNDTSVSYRR